jgi:hypothetical protein
MLRRAILHPEVSRYTVGGAVAAVIVVALVVGLLEARGTQPRLTDAGTTHRTVTTSLSPTDAGASVARIGAAAGAGAGSAGAGRAARQGLLSGLASSAAATSGAMVAEAPDPYQAESDPAPASVHHARAISPASAAGMIAPGAPSNAEIEHELAQMNAASKVSSGQTATATQTDDSVAGAGTVIPAAGLPSEVAEVIAGGDAIATFPYVYGGGHISFVDDAYDCSGSVSYALAAGGLLNAPETSGQLEHWGVAGPGKWITVFANAGHTYMYVDGLRFDTVGRSGIFGTRWQTAAPPEGTAGFVVRHWPGL